MKTIIASTWCGQPTDERDHVALEVEVAAQLHLVIDAPFYDDPPPKAPPGQLWGLWDFEVVELFLLGDEDHYLEIEIGPHGHHLVLSLHGARNVTGRHLPTRVEVERGGGRWRAQLELRRDLLPAGLRAFNAYAIHGSGPTRRHLAAHPVPGEAPDFHRLAHFAPWPLN